MQRMQPSYPLDALGTPALSSSVVELLACHVDVVVVDVDVTPVVDDVASVSISLNILMMPRRVDELKQRRRSDSPLLTRKPTFTVLPRNVMSAANWPTMSSGEVEPKPKKSSSHGLMLGLSTSSANVSSSITI